MDVAGTLSTTPADRAPSLPVSTWIALLMCLAMVMGALYSWSREQGALSSQVRTLTIKVDDLQRDFNGTRAEIMRIVGAEEERRRARRSD